MEIVTPLVNQKHASIDADRIPTELVFAFNVWTAGTTNKILQTDKLRATPSPHSCVPGKNFDFHYDTQFFNDDISLLDPYDFTRVGMLLDTHTTCEKYEDGKYHPVIENKTIWYSADVTNGASYKRVWNGWGVKGASKADWDNDGTEELMLTLEKRDYEPPRVSRRLFGLSQAAIAA